MKTLLSPANTPRCIEDLRRDFGDPLPLILPDGMIDSAWARSILATIDLPFPIPLSWDRTRSATRLRCHRKAASIFRDAFAKLKERGLERHVKSFGGCYAFRAKRRNHELSTHCWGLAVDLNPETNALGTAGDMSAEVVEVFASLGFEWGGSWTGAARDPMHFQFCRGY
jgi:hypothetical protein